MALHKAMLPTFFKRVLLTSLIIFAVPLLSQTVHALQIPENVEAVSPPKLDGLKKRVQNNSDSVTQEFEELDRFFAANPNHEQQSRGSYLLNDKTRPTPTCYCRYWLILAPLATLHNFSGFLAEGSAHTLLY